MMCVVLYHFYPLTTSYIQCRKRIINVNPLWFYQVIVLYLLLVFFDAGFSMKKIVIFVMIYND